MLREGVEIRSAALAESHGLGMVLIAHETTTLGTGLGLRLVSHGYFSLSFNEMTR